MSSFPASYGQVPSIATAQVSPFKLSISDDAVKELQTLLSLSKLAPVTYESLQDRKYGVSHDWLSTARATWLNDFDWFGYSAVRRMVC